MPAPPRVALMLDLEWPYKRHAGVFAGTQQYAQEQGWESIIDEFADDTLPARRTKSVPYDGVIARATKQMAVRAARLDVPVVNVWLSSPARDLLPGVFPDYAAAGHLAAEHLLARGIRHFAALSSRRDRADYLVIKEFSLVVRAAGYPCVIAKVPLTPSKNLAQWRKTEQDIAAWMDDWQRPIGVYIGADDMGRQVAQLCRERGWRVPEDAAIIAGHNEPTICEHPRPSLTSVEFGYERIGYEAARLLDRLMKEKRKGAKQKNVKKKGSSSKQPNDGAGKTLATPIPKYTLLAPQSLIVRESTDFFAVDDDLVAAALEFIAAQCHKPIDTDAVAQAVSTEKRTLQRRFRQHLDRPIATEIRRVRIERAKRELTQTDRTLASISRDVGFGEPARMYEIFLRELGVTPTEYRKRRQRQDGK